MNRFFVGATDVETIGCITSLDGIFSEAPIGGDLLEFDWVPGGQWIMGPGQAYTFPVPLALGGPEFVNTVVALQTIKSWRGTPLTLTRKYYIGTVAVPVLVTQTCSAVLTASLTPDVQLARFMNVNLLFQNLTGGWTTT